MSKKTVFIFLSVLVLVGLTGFLVKLMVEQSSSKPGALPKEVVVTLTKDGFKPETVTVPVGGAVRWKNESGGAATVNSDNYPDNNLYRDLNLGEFQENSTLALILSTKGTYGYHDHLHPERKGKVVVE
jgi:plastocyanin